MKEKIIFSEKIIENICYLNNSFFLIFGKKLLDNLGNEIDDEIRLKNGENIILIMKILENFNQSYF